MKLHVLYFAALRERMGRAEEWLDVSNDVANVAQLRGWLTQRGEPWLGAFSEITRVRAAVDQTMVD